jgi:NADPH-dependent 2,4-dienoyl-CoA reductase/sulfur reductase-like enzyme
MTWRCICIAVLIGTVMAIPLHGANVAQPKDLVVYGGTASGVIASYSAAQQGLQVVLLEEVALPWRV